MAAPPQRSPRAGRIPAGQPDHCPSVRPSGARRRVPCLASGVWGNRAAGSTYGGTNEGHAPGFSRQLLARSSRATCSGVERAARRRQVVSEAKDAQPSGRSVLEELDSRIPTGFYCYLAVLACIGGFLFGYDISNIGSALGFIPYHLSSFATGYLVARASLGSAAVALIAGPLTDRFGRKSRLVTDAAIYAIGAILSAVT